VVSAVLPAVRNNVIQRFGFAMLCLYMVGPILNDTSSHLFGVVPRLTLVPLALLLVCTAFGGSVGRALQASMGRWWLAMFVIMLVGVPFSFWPGGSVALLQDFGLKRYVILFCVCAVQITAMQCIRFAYTYVVSATFLLLLCFRYGAVSASDGRFLIDQSLFFDNSNDLAIGLLLTATSLLFVFFASGFLLKIVAFTEIMLCIFYILKTGSRGTFLAVIIAAAFALVFAKRKLLALVLVPSLLIALIAFVPSKTIQRLMSIMTNTDEAIAAGTAGSDVESQIARQDLVKLSLKLTFEHPLLGVGPGMFDDFVQQGARQAGTHLASLSTHNAYTQISSECGIPAFICYVATLILTIKLNYRMYKSFSKLPQIDGRLTGIAFSGFIGGIAYVVASTFHHIAYGVSLPWMGGETIALWLATQPMLSDISRVIPRIPVSERSWTSRS
jgi:O-antigen ligase